LKIYKSNYLEPNYSLLCKTQRSGTGLYGGLCWIRRNDE